MSPIEKLIARFKPSPGEESRIDTSISNFNLRVKNQENERRSGISENMDEAANADVADENAPRLKEEAKSLESADMNLKLEA